MKEYMVLADLEAKKNEKKKFKTGGPFGAIIVKDGKIIAKAHNTVLKSNDPTAHAEINAIRKAGKKLKTYDLSNCILYTSCEPCPMCLSAIIWSNIKEVYYGNTKEDANEIGFRDDYIYKILKNEEKNNLKMINIYRDVTIDTFNNFKNNKIIY